MSKELNEEIWKPVIGWEEFYEVSNLGRVKGLNRLSSSGKRLQSKIRKSVYNKKGYLILGLSKNGINKMQITHRLVAKAFIPNPNNLPQINHKDGDKTNNKPENLEWVTSLENIKHAYATGLKEGMPGETNGRALSSNKEVEDIIERYNIGEKASEIVKSTGLTLFNIREILFGKSWSTIDKEVEKRDDRGNWSEDHAKNLLISRFNTTSKFKPKTIVQLTKEGKEVARFRSINQASILTNICRKSIEAVVNNKQFFNKNGTYWEMKQAGGFIWKKIEINLNEFKELL